MDLKKRVQTRLAEIASLQKKSGWKQAVFSEEIGKKIMEYEGEIKALLWAISRLEEFRLEDSQLFQLK